MIAGFIFLIGVAIIARLWWTGHPEIIDRGDTPGNPPRRFWNDHSKLHLFGAALIAVSVAILDAASTDRDGFIAGALVSFGLWGLVEVAQKFPRDKQGGMVEWSDVWWNFVGAFAGAWLGGFVGSLVFGG